MSRNTSTFWGLQIVSIFHFHTYFFSVLRNIMFHGCPTLPHFILFSPEIAPTIIMHEDEEQEQADGDLNDAQRIEPFPETNLNVMLY
jgi:hypothetical protein